MSEVHRKVTPYEYNYLCDSCNNGMMKATGNTDDNGHFEHSCMICSAKTHLHKAYPHIEYFGEGEHPAD